MSATLDHTVRTAAPAADPDLPSVAKAATWALGACLAVTMALFAAASFAGTPLDVVRSDGREVAVTSGTVGVSVLLAVGVGTLLLALVGHRSRRAWLAVAAAGTVAGVASTAAPLTSTGAPVTIALLVAMHVLCGLVWTTVLVSLLRRAT